MMNRVKVIFMVLISFFCSTLSAMSGMGSRTSPGWQTSVQTSNPTSTGGVQPPGGSQGLHQQTQALTPVRLSKSKQD